MKRGREFREDSPAHERTIIWYKICLGNAESSFLVASHSLKETRVICCAVCEVRGNWWPLCAIRGDEFSYAQGSVSGLESVARSTLERRSLLCARLGLFSLREARGSSSRRPELSVFSIRVAFERQRALFILLSSRGRPTSSTPSMDYIYELKLDCFFKGRVCTDDVLQNLFGLSCPLL